MSIVIIAGPRCTGKTTYLDNLPYNPENIILDDVYEIKVNGENIECYTSNNVYKFNVNQTTNNIFIVVQYLNRIPSILRKNTNHIILTQCNSDDPIENVDYTPFHKQYCTCH